MHWDTAIQRSLTWNDIWHMAPLRISFLIRSVYDLLPSNANLVRWRKKDDPTSSLCQGLLDGCDDWVVSADLPEWERHPDVIRKTALRPDIVIYSASTQQIIMVELTVPYESRMEEAHAFKERKHLDFTKELKKDGYEAKVMPVEIGARGFVGSSAYGILSKLSIGGNKRTKALRLLAETAENSSRWKWSRRNERLLHKD
ncbi:reverse transcriptase [Plakobranchus ocellatus]|uniref:Reverse transcriptase n=1 Tax=Plakobranchus ocellatus TaxID=259542 RepID=A0AAV4ARZ6_9GAST|nr:reverse transcriptase [Plakobranchus ocellatus]